MDLRWSIGIDKPQNTKTERMILMITHEHIKSTFASLVAIDSPSLSEREMADYIKTLFAGIGIVLQEDESGTATGSTAGNLYAYVEGDPTLAPILLAAHMDTVAPACGKQAICHEDGQVTSDGTTVLGADDLAGVTAIYEALREIREQGCSHRPVELLFTTGEELYCKGANAFDFSRIRSRNAYVLDLSGEIGSAAYAAPTLLSFEARIQGRASHAGFRPEDGINAILAASKAIAQLPQGHIDAETTGNIGMIHGGAGTNIVSESCTIKGEIRSLKHERALALLKQYKSTFEKETSALGASLVWSDTVNIIAYETPLEGSAVSAYRQAVEQEGLTVSLYKTFGGSDQNVFAQHGIEGLVIATSMNCVHTCQEYCSIPEIAQVSHILLGLLDVSALSK